MTADITRHKLMATIFENGTVMFYDGNERQTIKVLLIDYGNDWIAFKVPGQTHWCNDTNQVAYRAATVVFVNHCKFVSSDITEDNIAILSRPMKKLHKSEPFEKKIDVYETQNTDASYEVKYGIKEADAKEVVSKLLAFLDSE